MDVCSEREIPKLVPLYLGSLAGFVCCPETPGTLTVHGSCGEPVTIFQVHGFLLVCPCTSLSRWQLL